jgi:hypothetical protein
MGKQKRRDKTYIKNIPDKKHIKRKLGDFIEMRRGKRYILGF